MRNAQADCSSPPTVSGQPDRERAGTRAAQPSPAYGPALPLSFPAAAAPAIGKALLVTPD